ncbi:7-carboxy-7-deazaguanine synthase QueE [Paraferrimonas sp. SM1919]|uniref:7-carboxy-7-deazaguanine synthase QueE n=1 Tax=Paraferrimonas sp. SM1919 TaxID=2662263 RepID=UPI0013D23991|nr:7-carboxy-7-deazaguanine synthase QueE [Paraferrimonas sp. SM1919]
MKYPINEVFETIQGEGSHTGVPAIFVRLQGCDVGCSWCDTKQTWALEPQNQVAMDEVIQVDGTIGRWSMLTPSELISRIAKFNAKLVVVTGGEPAMYDLMALSLELERAGYQVQLETSGTYPISISDNAFVTVSPKVNMQGKKTVLKSALERANEIKHPVATAAHIDDLNELLAQIDSNGKAICLQPISQKPRATELAIATCIANNWRLSIQTHKYINID